MDWKIVLWIAFLCFLGWYVWTVFTQPVQQITIKPLPKSHQIQKTPKIPEDPIAPYFTPARDVIPKDESMIVQACPFSKPFSTDLPIVDMPRCTVLSEKSYRMSEFKH